MCCLGMLCAQPTAFVGHAYPHENYTTARPSHAIPLPGQVLGAA